MEHFCPEISQRNKVSRQSQFDSLLSDLRTTAFDRRCVRFAYADDRGVSVRSHFTSSRLPVCRRAARCCFLFFFFFLCAFIVELLFFALML